MAFGDSPIKILEAVYFVEGGEIFTKGKYRVIEVFGDDKIYFEGFKRVDYDF